MILHIKPIMDPSELVTGSLHCAVQYILGCYTACVLCARTCTCSHWSRSKRTHRCSTMQIACNTNLIPLHMCHDFLHGAHIFKYRHACEHYIHNLTHIAAYIDCQPWWPDGRTWGKWWSAWLRWTFPRFHGWFFIQLYDWECWMLKSCWSILPDAFFPLISYGYINLSKDLYI